MYSAEAWLGLMSDIQLNDKPKNNVININDSDTIQNIKEREGKCTFGKNQVLTIKTYLTCIILGNVESNTSSVLIEKLLINSKRVIASFELQAIS